MPIQPSRRPTVKQNGNAHKKAKIAFEEKTKPLRKGTPPKLKSKQKPRPAGPHAVSSKKSHIVVAEKQNDSKGKGKAKAIPSVESDANSEDSSLPSSFKIIAGTYEKLLYGLQGSVSVEGGARTFALKPIFIFPAHISCIKTVAASPHGGKWLATGSVDEIIKVWDLRRRKEVGGLMHHEGMSHITLLYFLFTYLSVHIRFHNAPRISISLPPALRVRRRFIMHIPSQRLDCASRIERSQGKGQFSRVPSVRQGCSERGQR